jgi:hypothetical protein
MVTCDPNERKKERYLKELLSRKKKEIKLMFKLGRVLWKINSVLLMKIWEDKLIENTKRS